MRRPARILGALAAAALGCASAGAVDRGELSEQPIALLHRTEELALDRLDVLRDFEARQRGPDREGVARVEDVRAAFFEDALETRMQRFQGYLALLDPRTGDTARVEGAPNGAAPRGWSADRRRLLLSGRWRESYQLFVWERETQSFEIATTGPGSHPDGCLGAGGELVAVELTAAGGVRSRLMRAPSVSGALAPLTDGPADADPACSPTAPIVAFVRVDEDGVPAIVVLPGDGGAPRTVATGQNPAFTPDGAWIVYAARTRAGTKLWRVRPDGSGRSPLGPGVNQETHPTVSPDGRVVAYVVRDEGRRERIWVRRFEGGGDRPLLSDGDGALPTW